MRGSLLKPWHLAVGGALFCAGVALLVAGCVAQLSLSDTADLVPHRGAEPVLNMGQHLETEMAKIACIDCHPGAETEDRAGMPDRDLCLSCHGGLVGVDMFDLGGDFFEADGKPKWTVTAALPEGISFSHVRHKEFDCAECHGDMEHDDYSLADLAGRFENCRRCHPHEGPSGRCDHCHTSLVETKRPHSHGHGWQRRHGRRVRDRGGPGGADRVCLRCHQQSYCTSCHREEKPRDHTMFWVRAGHGPAADIDRSRCYVCHRQDQCVRCHLDEAPPMPLDGDHVSPYSEGCIQPGCHPEKLFGHVILTQNCRFCHR